MILIPAIYYAYVYMGINGALLTLTTYLLITNEQ